MIYLARMSLLLAVLAWTGAAAVISNDTGSVFDPNDASAVNAGATWTGVVTIDTDAKTIDTGGGPVAVPADDAVSEDGDVTLTMFTFANLTIDPASVVTVTGSRGLVLATTGSLTVNGTINAAGANGTDTIANNTVAPGGIGGPGGGTGGDTGGVHAAAGGPGTSGAAPTNNGGLGASVGGQFGGSGEKGGGGGAFAGAGGPGSNASGGATSAGGVSYGESALSELYGGSGGGGGHRSINNTSGEFCGAGGGGGAIELVSRGTLILNGSIDASGGDGGIINHNGGPSGNDYGGGGGGGGGVILAGINLVIGATASVDASGGDGSQDPTPVAGSPGDERPAGGGGGGRIAIHANGYSDAGGTFTTTGGAKSNWQDAGAHTNGGAGEFTIIGTYAPAAPSATALSDSVFDPDDGVSNGTHTWSSAVVIDTTLKTVTIGGLPSFLAFQDVVSVAGDVTLQALTFTDLTIDPAVTVTVTGAQGLIIAATNNLTHNGAIVASGVVGGTAANAIATGGAGGPGGGAGGDSGGTAFASNGQDGSAPANNGGLTGTVGGQIGGLGTDQGSSGGAYGGVGGVGSSAGTSPTSTSVAYGDAALAELYGGSGGGGGHRGFNGTTMGAAGGGGGGGSIELVARGTLAFNGSVDVSGGAGGPTDPDGGSANDYGGGGGGGGGVILAGINVVLDAASSVTAAGGDGSQDPAPPSTNGTDQRPAGGGGGGRVAVYADNFTDNGVTIDVSGGAKTDWQTTSVQTDGSDGTYSTVKTVSLAAAPAINAVAGSIMDPNLAVSNGNATWSSAVTINTTTRLVTVGGTPAFVAFQRVNSVGGDADLLALTFDNLTIDPAVVVTVTGDSGLILAATNNLSMNGSIDVSGANGANAAGNNVVALGGAGGPGGGSGGQTGGLTPGPGSDGTPAANNGGLAANTAGERGDDNQGGGGGSFGGAGGTGSNEGGTPSDGGIVYGADALDELYGGSGGGGGHRNFAGTNAEFAGAGGGGGALELVARGTLTLNGSIDASGGDGGSLNAQAGPSPNDYGGGGGGGGGVIVAGSNVVITTATTIDVSGGDASPNSGGAQTGTNRPAGGGGGGRIAILADSLSNDMGSNLAGGQRSDWHSGTPGHSAGSDGSIYFNATTNLVPTAVTALTGSILDPNDAVTSGTQTWSANVTIDTTNGSVLVGGTPVTANFQRVASVGGDATMAALTFVDLTIDPAVTISVSGDYPLILAATNNLTLNGDIDASGADGGVSPANNTIALGGAAGAGGGAGGDTGGNNVTGGDATAGGVPANNGGLGASVAGQRGADNKGGGGGANGGAGGDGSSSGSQLAAGGTLYGDEALAELYGGSGGGGGRRNSGGTSMEAGGGGGGGGAIQLVARGTLAVNGGIDVSGGDGGLINGNGGFSGNDYAGGGGGGGSVLLAGINLSIGTAATVNADGGDGSQDSTARNSDGGDQRPGGGGGGGRIAIYADSIASGGSFSTEGGAESNYQFEGLNSAGADGSIRQFSTSTFVPVGSVTAANGSIFDPNDGLSNGAATWAGNVSINTDSGNVVVGGVPQAVDWTDATSASGNVTLKMLTFSDLTISPGVIVTVEGSNGLVLAATNNLTHDGTINADGQTGGVSPANNFLAPGGLGGPGGGDGGITDNAVDEGTHSTTAGSPPPGLGLTAANAGQFETTTHSGGGGGSYAEAGGNGSDAVAATDAVGGTAYGNDAIDDLYGGSGGGGGNRTSAGNTFSGGGGGGGGGALELIARGTLSVSGTVTANGGDGGDVDPDGGVANTDYGGGGGGGGGIILAGINVAIASTALIEANGGDGSPDANPPSNDNPGVRPAGGGGAGRIAVYADNWANAGSFSVDGGEQSNFQGSAPASDGGEGSVASIPTVSLVPTPIATNSGIASIILPDPANTNGPQTWSAPVVIDTDLKSITVGGVPIAVTASDASSVTGKVTLTMFTFSDLTIDPGVNVTVQGSRGVVLGATGTITVNGTIDASGGDGGNGADPTGVGAAGVGGPGGGDGGQGAPSAGGGGRAGEPASGIGVPSNASGQIGSDTGGAGGGYAGVGGIGRNNSGGGSSTGGVSYGDDALTELYGGSGGAGSNRSTNDNYELTGGGGGGGAVELVANVAIIIDGTVDASGGDGGSVDTSSGGGSNNDYAGGGGSGGGILVAAPIVTIGATGTLDADGGRGGQRSTGTVNSGHDRPGGGGSGGRIAIYSDSLTNNGTITRVAGVASDFDSYDGSSNGPGGDGIVGTLSTPPGGFALAVPTLSQWGIIILSLLVACVGMIRISQMYPTGGHRAAIATAWPLDAVGFTRSLRVSLGIAVVGWTLSLLIFGTIAFSDLVGGSLAVPVFAYFLHLFPLLAKRD